MKMEKNQIIMKDLIAGSFYNSFKSNKHYYDGIEKRMREWGMGEKKNWKMKKWPK
jgi:hypothetical protein